jgi:O-antigen ligase
MAVACALGTLLTGSRGGFVCLLIAGGSSLVLAGVARRRILTILQVATVIVFVYVLVRYIVPAALLDRVTRPETLAEDPRMRIWARGLGALWQNPLFGVGAGAYAPATLISGERGSVAHNAFLSVVVELGVVGLAIYLTYVVMLFRAAWRMPRREKLLWTGVMVVWFFNANSAGSQTDKFGWFLHVMVLVQAAACTQHRPVRHRPVRKRSPYPSRAVTIVRRPTPPRSGRP